LYRNGQYREAADLLTAFIRRYPTSSYLGEAQQTLDFALQQVDLAATRVEPVELGILLPLGGQDTPLTQALFNGIRLAVDAHNAANARGPKVRMIFRDTGGEAGRAAAAVRELAGLGADVLVGPLYSAEARAAGAAAEQAGVVLVAPLATDEDVSEDRRFVFQANPTIFVRGQQTARFAQRELRLRSFGIVAERAPGGLGERMGDGFQQEVVFQGGDLQFYELLENTRGWSQLDQLIGPDTLARVQAIYLPVSGDRAGAHAEAALASLERAGATVHVVGNDEWHNLRNRELASRFEATYSVDFYVSPNSTAAAAFQQDYRRRFGDFPESGSTRSRLAFTGYDLTQFLLGQMTRQPERPLHEGLRQAPAYDGLGIRIDFQNGNVNQALYFFQYRDGRVERLR